MKKRLTTLLLAAALLCALAAQALAEETALDNMLQANQLETLLKRSPRVGVKTDLYDSQGNIHSRYYYGDGSLLVSETEDYIHIDQDGMVFGFDIAEAKPFAAIYLDDTDPVGLLDGISLGKTGSQELLECTRGDGKLMVTTRLTDEQGLEVYRTLLLRLGYQDQALEGVTFRYILEEDTYEYRSYSVEAECAGNHSILLQEYTRLEAQPYEIAPELLEQVFAQDKRTATVIADPDTPAQRVYTAQAGKGCEFLIYATQEHPNLYLDKDFTQPVEAMDDYESDLLFYTVSIDRDPLYNLEQIQPYPSEDNMAWCEFCGKWYEAGNVFRNHICIGSEMQPYPEEEQCQACGAWYEKGTTHVCPPVPPEMTEMAQCPVCGKWFETGNIFRNHICNP